MEAQVTATIESKMLVELVQRFGVSKHRFTAAGQTETSPLPKLVPLTTVPNVLCETSIAETILFDEKEECDARCIAWAKCLGIWSVISMAPKADKALKSAVGEALNGTMARAEWDLGGCVAGIRVATTGLAIETNLAVQAWTEGVNEGSRLLFGKEVP